MPSFHYRGRSRGGDLVTGKVQAVSAEAAASDLLGSNITPIEIYALKTNAAGAGRQAGQFREQFSALLPRSKIEPTDLIVFSRQMFSLAKAGIPLDRALRGLEASVTSVPLKKVLHDVATQLEKGMDLTGALARHPKVFSSLYLSLIHVGENTGRLDLAFEQVGRYLELGRDTRRQIKTATRYPMFVIASIAAALAVITMFVIPVFAETFAKLQTELPWQTLVLISISDFAVAWWPFILLGLGLMFYGIKYYVGTPPGRHKWDRRKLRLPLVGTVYERVALSRFSRTFAMMMKAGVPIVQALNVIARAVGNQHIGTNVERMRDGISHGESLYQVAVKSAMFSPLVLQMIAVGEESGSVGELLEEVADFYDSEVEYDLKKMSAAIEPILIVCVAGIVLVLALGVFLPIWDLASAVR